MKALLQVVMGVFSWRGLWLISAALILILLGRSRWQRAFRAKEAGRYPRTIAFLHPHCNAGGGGERVLWAAISALQEAKSICDHIIVYCGHDGISDKEYIANAKRTFGLDLSGPPSSVEREGRGKHVEITFIRLWTRPLIEAHRYKRFTLLFQMIGMAAVGLECILQSPPNVSLVIDTIGCPFAYFAFAAASIPVLPYVHYPYISQEWIQANAKISPKGELRRQAMALGRAASLLYYTFIGAAYGLCGRTVSVAAVNSSWTEHHMRAAWGKHVELLVVYPPCDLNAMAALDIIAERQPMILSFSQFRKEKNQAMQLHILAALFKRSPTMRESVRLVLMGGCRNAEDMHRVSTLKVLARALSIDESVEFIVDAGRGKVVEMLSRASIGLHTMFEEHFGISIVEMMAAGLVTIAHDSGGPQSDIILDESQGFLCTTVEQYAEALERLLSPTRAEAKQQVEALRHSSRASALDRFSSATFNSKLLEICQSVSQTALPPLSRKTAKP